MTSNLHPVMAQALAPFVSPGAKIGHENREAVRRFFAEHIGCTNAECAKALGLSIMAVGRHLKTLRQEWAATA